MFFYSQLGRPLSISTPLGPDVLLLERIEGREPLSGLFRFKLSLLADALLPIAFDQILGQPVTVRLALPGGDRYWHGIISRFAQGPTLPGRRGRNSLTRYRAVLSPRLWLLTQRVQSRIFQNQNVKQILKLVFDSAQLTVKYEGIQGDFPTRECRVQYQEPDFAFVSRLMEDEGIFYYFQHSDQDHTLVLANQPHTFPMLAIDPTLDATETERPSVNTIQRWDKRQDVTPGQWTLGDYSFEMANKGLAASKAIPEKIQVGLASHNLRVAGNDQLEVYEYPGGHGQRYTGISPKGSKDEKPLEKVFNEATRLAEVRMQEGASRALRMDGDSTCPQFGGGQRFRLLRPLDRAGNYVLTRVDHVASQEGAYSTGDEARPFTYANRFRCLPEALPFRPRRRTARPVIRGYQTAIVVGPTSSDVSTDEHGRIKVQFHWDRGGADEIKGLDGKEVLTFSYWQGRRPGTATSSAWVRVVQSWAGRRWGQFTVPRLGHEVLVGFVDGDPDQPVVVGSLYNSVNPVPFALPAQALASGWKTQTAGGGSDNFSGLAFNDTKGQENVQLQSQRNLILTSKGHFVTNVGGNWFENIQGTKVQLTGELPGFGAAGGDPKEKPEESTDQPWQWTIGGLSSSIGKTAQLTYGEAVTAVCGLQGSVTLGCMTTLVINPTSMLDTVFPNLSTLLSPVIGMLDGMNNLNLGPMLNMVYGTASSIGMGASTTVDPSTGDGSLKVLRNLCRVLAALSTAEFITFGAVGHKIKENWMKDNAWGSGGLAFAVAGGGLAAVGLATLITAQVVLYRTQTMKTAATNIKNSVAAFNQKVMEKLTDPFGFGDIYGNVQF